ncbi:MAG TPA: polysaccharide deacetylase family protein, partial [Polyangiaceae bacterium]|nr:polysaccharide deacetylase family protein [Polyangiaceae bacterium]
MMQRPPIISVDVEDWKQSTWDRSLPISERAAKNTDRVLEVLDQAGVHATMFVLGKFAEAFPGTVRNIQQAGHEVGCHGFAHEEIFHQSPEQFREDVRRAKHGIEDIIGAPVYGYRAPDFSIVRKTLWALDELAQLGFEYDSSIFPVRHSRYGIEDWPLHPTEVKLEAGRSILELPIATLPLFGRRLPVGGGGYHRLLPGFFARMAASTVMQQNDFMFYCHPYEFDPAELWDTSMAIPLKVRLHQGMGRGRFETRLRAFIRRFGGVTAKQALAGRALPTVCASD